MTFSFSPKVYVPVLIGLLASAALTLLTGDETYLAGALISLAGGVGGTIAPPAPGIKQREVAERAMMNRLQRGE